MPSVHAQRSAALTVVSSQYFFLSHAREADAKRPHSCPSTLLNFSHLTKIRCKNLRVVPVDVGCGLHDDAEDPHALKEIRLEDLGSIEMVARSDAALKGIEYYDRHSRHILASVEYVTIAIPCLPPVTPLPFIWVLVLSTTLRPRQQPLQTRPITGTHLKCPEGKR
jgi:hypothetical protein